MIVGRTLDVYSPLEKSREELSRVIGIIRVIVWIIERFLGTPLQVDRIRTIQFLILTV
jgi:hypothetical protein